MRLCLAYCRAGSLPSVMVTLAGRAALREGTDVQLRSKKMGEAGRRRKWIKGWKDGEEREGWGKMKNVGKGGGKLGMWRGIGKFADLKPKKLISCG